MAVFSVLLLTAAPPGQSGDPGNSMIKIDGREALLRTAELFLNRDNIKQIQVVFTAEQVEEAKRKHGGHFGGSGIKVVTGRPKWMAQWAAGGGERSADAAHGILPVAGGPPL